MRLVVDASVAVKWLVAEEDSDLALRVLHSDHELLAPRLMASEVSGALTRKVRRGQLERGLAAAIAAAIPEMVDTWAADDGVVPDAVRLSLTLDLPIYDCVYLALALNEGGIMVTADVRFVNAVARTEHREDVLSLEAFEGLVLE